MEKLLIEATLEAVRLPQILGLQDLGAGGLSTALPEMARNGGVGVELFTDRVPTRGPLTPYEIVLSESQERMVMCVEAGKEEEVIDIFRRWGLTAAVVGKVIEEEVFRIKDGERVVAEIPLGVIFSGLPVPEWIAEESPPSLWDYLRIVYRLVETYRGASGRKKTRMGAILQLYGFSTFPVGDHTGIHWADNEIKRESFRIQRAVISGKRDKDVEEVTNLIESYYSFLRKIASSRKEADALLNEKYVRRVALKVLSHPNVASKRWIYRQYDHMVGTDTVVGPGGGNAAVIRVKGKNYALAITVDGNGKYLAMDPYWGAQKVALESVLNITLTGGEVMGFTDGVNFPSPEDPNTYYRLQMALKGLGDFARFFGIPVVSGNVSLYNETEGKKIFPTLMVGAVGMVRDVFSVPSVGINREGLYVYTVGFPASSFDLGGSEFLSALLEEFPVEDVDENVLYRYYRKPDAHNYDLYYLRDLIAALSEMIRIGLVINAHDVSEGGLFAALSEMVLLGEGGVDVTVEGLGELFSETVPKVVLTTSMPRELEVYLSRRNLPYEKIGRTLEDPILNVRYYAERSVLLLKEDLEKAYYSTYEVDREGIKT